ncbi:DUF5333 domain-containing protein [Yangia mangrovi]|uniref:DUF5333 domain-containing protein n=1 Tax=Alloyangia mangrovi TaxID=1779329 RepID=A0A2A3JZQ6_9RHOB|nr:DUF5333 domain-containing protein [Alloyangia mangrovi]MCT4369963.1 DUF5333 domain-containing protein [Alloyangia mangrovi]
MSKLRTAVLAATLGALAVPSAALAKPPLGEVREIHDGLMAVGIADEIRNRCDNIGARMLTAMGTLNTLKKRARALGYSNAEIEDYVTSKAEKKKMRADGEAYLASRGVAADDTAGLCRVGREEIARGSAIGVLLREK